MKRLFVVITAVFASAALQSQTTWEMAYNVIQTNCGGCHIAGHESGLDLSGTIDAVYDNLYNVSPTNAVSLAKGYKRVLPGDPYKSFIFSKINNSLALDVNLEAGEGIACPQGTDPMNNKDIELIRQWIIYGALESDTLVDVALIADFYDNDGFQSIESPPAPPAPGEGFQVHFGPFFLWPETEHEYWLKFPTNIPEDVEVTRVETFMGEYSHHFITYKYSNAAIGAAAASGLHDLAAVDVFNTVLVSANQNPFDLVLPPNTALFWEANAVLDLNSHYLNYATEKSEACEAYINIYTQPAGTAIQQMIPVLLSDDGFYIPNDGVPYTHDAVAYDNSADPEDEIFIWSMTSHTHRHGSDFNIYLRNPDGSKGEQLFDASCGATEGVPGCLDEIYDYRHPPVRFWESMKPARPKYGIIYETTWINEEDHDLYFGLTSEDEMQVMWYLYLEDTTGLNLPVAINYIEQEESAIKIFPNPAHDLIYINAEIDLSGSMVTITDLTGKIIKQEITNYSGSKYYQMDIKGFTPGIYLINILRNDGANSSAKIIVQ